MRKENSQRSFTGERGSALVEFALICILFFTMILGIIDFSRALYAYSFVSNAAREATRFAVVNGSTCGNDVAPGSCTAPVSCSSGTCSTCTSGCTSASASDIQNYVVMLAPPGIDTTSSGCGGSPCLTTTATWPGNGTTACPANSNAPPCPVQVQVQYQFNFLYPMIRATSITMTSTSQMIISH